MGSQLCSIQEGSYGAVHAQLSFQKEMLGGRINGMFQTPYHHSLQEISSTIMTLPGVKYNLAKLQIQQEHYWILPP